MAGDVTVAVVSAQLSGSGVGTQDFVKAGFGTPKACIVLLSWDIADDASPIGEGKISIGFSDFTLDVCTTAQDEDGSAKVDCDNRKSNTKAYILLDVAGAVDIDGGASTIADGVRLTNTTNVSSRAVFATVIMFGGVDLQVSLDRVTTPNLVGGTQVVTTGIDQRLVFFIGLDISGEDSSGTGINQSYGVASINAARDTFVNRCVGWASDHNNNSGSPAAVLRNNRCLKILTETGGDDWGIELTAATATTYTITERDVTSGNGMEIYALALDLDNRASKVGSVDGPISGATWTPSVSLGFTPQYVGLALTHARVEGTIETDADAGGLGISSDTGAGAETCHSWYNEDAAATINTNNLFRSRVIDLRDHDVATVIQDHSHLSFDSGGWTYTINTENETVARKWFYWAIQEVAAGPITRAFDETMSLAEVLGKKVLLDSFDETMSFSEAFTRKFTLAATVFAETLSLAEAFAAKLIFFKSFSETASLAEAFVPRVGKVFAEALGFAETLGRKVFHGMGETLSVAESLSVVTTFKKAFAETKSMAEAFATNFIPFVPGLGGGVMRRRRRRHRRGP